ncbi:hypothetical protein FACS1894170_11780 [Planctomycetales bacterium]|nr:hypothetical protein FACS1894170_11780 [Planctomycetales bacterium]
MHMGQSPAYVPLCLVGSDDIEVLGHKVKNIVGSSLHSGVLNGFGYLAISYQRKLYTVLCVNQTEDGLPPTDDDDSSRECCYPHLSLALDIESGGIIDPGNYYGSNVMTLPKLQANGSRLNSFSDFMVGYDEMFLYRIGRSLEFDKRENECFANIRFCAPSQVIVGTLDSLISLVGCLGEKFETNFLNQPLVEHSFVSLLGFDKDKYQATKRSMLVDFQDNRWGEVILAAILEASNVDRVLEKILFSYAVALKSPRYPMLLSNAMEIQEKYNHGSMFNC